MVKTIVPVRLLTPEGTRCPHPEYDMVLDPDELCGLYRDMVVARRVDAEGVTLQRQGELALWPSALGQEAAQIGSARALVGDDHAFPSHRDHGVALCMGIDPVALFAMFRGANNGGWDPRENNFHLYTFVIGSHALHATGYAMGMARDGAVGAAVGYFGDGATSQGDVNEALNFAAVYAAPIVFFCQNNQWAISEPNDRQTRVPICQRAAGFGMPGVRVDGNDVLACLAVTRAALRRARGGGGPTLVEAFTYRMGAHTTSDDPARYRDPDEVAAWAALDPIARLKNHLVAGGWTDEAFLSDVEEEAEALARRVRAAVREMPAPDGSLIFDHVYATEHTQVAAERAEFMARRSRLAEFDVAPFGLDTSRAFDPVAVGEM